MILNLFVENSSQVEEVENGIEDCIVVVRGADGRGSGIPTDQILELIERVDIDSDAVLISERIFFDRRHGR